MRIPSHGCFASLGFLVLVGSIAVASDARAETQAAPKPGARKPAPAAPRKPAATSTSSPALTNADVLQMVGAKLSEDLILNAIEDAPKKAFDLSVTGLVALKNGGASDQIIRVMQGRPRTAEPEPVPVPVPSASPAVVVSRPDPPPAAPGADAPDNKGNPVSRFFGRFHGKGDDAAPEGTAPASAQPAKLENGQPASIPTTLSTAAAVAKVKAYLNSRNLDFTVNPDTGRILSDWFAERRCGPGIQHCANRASIRVAPEAGKTVIRIQVTERKREGGVSEKPWHENSESKGKETALFASQLEAFLGQPAK